MKSIESQFKYYWTYFVGSALSMAISGDNHWSSESRRQHWSEYELHGECLIKSIIYSSFASTWIQPRFLWVRVTHHLSFLCCCFFFICLRSVSCDQSCLCIWNDHSWLSPSPFPDVYWLNQVHCPLHYSLTFIDWIKYTSPSPISSEWH